MTKQELYRDLCIEAGTYTGGEMSAEQWYAKCAHNITPGQDQTLDEAANGDAAALAEARQDCGVPVLALTTLTSTQIEKGDEMKTTALKTTTLVGFAEPVIVTKGGILNGRQIFGVFATEEDARIGADADHQAIAIIGEQSLTAEQIADAEANSEALASA